MTYTTQQLQAMSDFEVNKALHLWLLTRKPKEGLESITYRPSGAFDVRFKCGANFLSHLKDYCNNPNDIMPLSFERGISIIFDDEVGYWDAATFYWLDDSVMQYIISFSDANPLRAIACLLLMMED